MVELFDVAGAEYAFARHEHAELRAGLDHMNATARAIAQLSTDECAARVRPVCAWLTEVLLPHVAWEGTVIFPEIDELSATTWPTRLMRFEHSQINRRVVALDKHVDRLCGTAPSADERLELHDQLIAIEALIRAHLEREEAFLLPYLNAQPS